MDAPKCRLCGERHYGLCPGIVPHEGTPRPTPYAIWGDKVVTAEGTFPIISEPEKKSKPVTKNTPLIKSDTTVLKVTGRGRPPKSDKLSPAERTKRYRTKKTPI